MSIGFHGFQIPNYTSTRSCFFVKTEVFWNTLEWSELILHPILCGRVFDATMKRHTGSCQFLSLTIDGGFEKCLKVLTCKTKDDPIWRAYFWDGLQKNTINQARIWVLLPRIRHISPQTTKMEPKQIMLSEWIFVPSPPLRDIYKVDPNELLKKLYTWPTKWGFTAVLSPPNKWSHFSLLITDYWDVHGT